MLVRQRNATARILNGLRRADNSGTGRSPTGKGDLVTSLKRWSVAAKDTRFWLVSPGDGVISAKVVGRRESVAGR